MAKLKGRFYMKVCIIGHTERNYLPYMEKYVNYFEENRIKYDIICWQREEKNVVVKDNEYNYYEQVEDGIFNKLNSYNRFKKFVVSILKQNQYDKVIVLTTVPCIALRKYLLKHYKDKYIFDFRDYSFEKFTPYRKLVEKMIENSAFTTISSKGFMDFLSPNKKIIMNHNINFTEDIKECEDISKKSILNIGFVGGVRYFEENVALIEKLKNEFKYQLWYIGQPTKTCDLDGYCKEHDIKNVSFVGKYDNKQKPELYKNIDIINSIYGDDSLEVTTALPNRLYEACLFKKPIISSKRTYLGEVINDYNLGVVLDIEKEDALGIINHYVDEFDKDAFEKGCAKFLEDVQNDEQNFYKQLKQFIKK